MTTIASPNNPGLKTLRRLRTKRGRAQSGRFFAEGEDLIAAAAAAGCAAIEGYRVAGSRVGGPRFHDVEPEALAAVSTLGSGTRAIGVYEQRWLQGPVGPVCVYLHGVRDPGNVGTVIRSALAFGAACVALGADCADPFSPKAVRASMGAIFAVQLARVHDPARLPGERVALVAGAGERLAAVSERLARAPVVSLLVGAERAGIEPIALTACQHVARIPIATDSLNAAMAATVALYELARTRANPPAPDQATGTRPRSAPAPDQATGTRPRSASADDPPDAPAQARPSTQARPSRVRAS
jgi:TrmH family RNA methyltransferase